MFFYFALLQVAEYDNDDGWAGSKNSQMTSAVSPVAGSGGMAKAAYQAKQIQKQQNKLKICVKLAKLGLPIIFVVFSLFYFSIGLGFSFSFSVAGANI
jgi:hypothetical protein